MAGAIFIFNCQGAHNKRLPVQATPPASTRATTPLPLSPLRPNLVPPSAEYEGDLLLSEVEALYQKGLDLYRQGGFVAAREVFDQALTRLLEFPRGDVSDPRMAETFNRLVEDIHALELTAFENGDGMAMQKYEAAPIEEFAEQTFQVDPALKQQIDQRVRGIQSDLPMFSNETVDGLVTYFQGDGRPFIEKVLRRIGRYRSTISPILRKHGLPQDLIYLAAAESGFNPFALSRAGAKGLWQFMRYEGKKYGCRIDSWVDEREDPVKATEAAASYLKELYQEFGDWLLAMASYNGGRGRVGRAIERTGYADFWELHKRRVLPRETRNYVPIILATVLIAKEPWIYGFHVVPDDPLAHDQMVVGAPVDLRLVAQITDHPVKELIEINPGLLRWATPLNTPEFVLKLPLGTGEKFLQEVEKIPPKNRLWWRIHTIKSQDSLPKVAKKYKISALKLAQANHLAMDAPLEVGAKLVLPLSPGQEVALRHGRSRQMRYRIRRGDTLGGIARRFRISVRQIQRWNGIRGSRIIAGKTLRLYVPYVGGRSSSRGRRSSAGRSSTGSSRLVKYRIRNGDSLSSIAQRYKVKVSQIRRWNRIRGSHIRAGRTLRLYVGSSSKAMKSAGSVVAPSRSGSSRTAQGGQYKVRQGDTLSAIARRFNVTMGEIRRWNGMRSSRILAGQFLRVSPSTGQVESAPRKAARPDPKAQARGQVFRYRVRRGDTLWEIAQRFQVTPQEIRRWNKIPRSRTRIVAGQTLRLYVPSSRSASPPDPKQGTGSE